MSRRWCRRCRTGSKISQHLIPHHQPTTHNQPPTNPPYFRCGSLPVGAPNAILVLQAEFSFSRLNFCSPASIFALQVVFLALKAVLSLCRSVLSLYSLNSRSTGPVSLSTSRLSLFVRRFPALRISFPLSRHRFSFPDWHFISAGSTVGYSHANRGAVRDGIPDRTLQRFPRRVSGASRPLIACAPLHTIHLPVPCPRTKPSTDT